MMSCVLMIEHTRTISFREHYNFTYVLPSELFSPKLKLLLLSIKAFSMLGFLCRFLK